MLKSFQTRLLCILVIFLAGVLILDFMEGKITSASALTSQDTLQTLQTTSIDGKNVTLAIQGNVSASQFNDLFFQNLPDWYNNTNINFDLTGLNGSTAFVNMTIPKSAILGGTEPAVATNGIIRINDGFTQDNENFYVWFTTQPQWDNNNQSYVTIQFLLATHHKTISACTQTLTIPALGTQTAYVTVNQGETLSGEISVLDNQMKDINFRITDPNGNSVIHYNQVTSSNWNLVASKNGTYTLTIDNSSPVFSSKTVILAYYVSSNAGSGGGSDPFLFLVIVIGLIIVVVGLVVVLLVTRRLKANTSPQQNTFQKNPT